MTDCVDIREALLRGEALSSPERKAHLDGCPACAALSKSAGPLRAALFSSDAMAVDVDALFQEVKGNIAREQQDMRGFLRSRPTWMRIALALIAIVLVITPVILMMPRPDMADYPRGRMIATVAMMTISVLVTLWIALRPAYRPPLPKLSIAGATSGAIALLLLFSMIPVEGSTFDSNELLRHAMGCLFFGVLLGIPVYIIVRALDHEVTRLAAVLAATTAGMTANLALHLHCPNTHPGHVLLGHFGVAVLFLGFVAVAGAIMEKARAR